MSDYYTWNDWVESLRRQGKGLLLDNDYIDRQIAAQWGYRTVRSWLFGTNATLNGQSPASVLRESFLRNDPALRVSFNRAVEYFLWFAPPK